MGLCVRVSERVRFLIFFLLCNNLYLSCNYIVIQQLLFKVRILYFNCCTIFVYVWCILCVQSIIHAVSI